MMSGEGSYQMAQLLNSLSFLLNGLNHFNFLIQTVELLEIYAPILFILVPVLTDLAFDTSLPLLGPKKI